MRQTIGAEIGLARFLQMHGMRNLSRTLHFSSILRPALCAVAIVLALADARPAMAGGVPDCEAMLDPETNIRYAVRFLKELHTRKGSWEAAVKHYHSPDPDRGARYHRAFETARAAIDPTAAGRGNLMTVTGEPAATGVVALLAGGLFGQALPAQQAGVAPYGASIATTPEIATAGATESAYAALLDLLAERDGADIAFVPAQAELAKTSHSPVLRKQWDRVEAFCDMFQSQP